MHRYYPGVPGTTGWVCGFPPLLDLLQSRLERQESEFWLENENLHELTLEGEFPARGPGKPKSLPSQPPLPPGAQEGQVELEDFEGTGTFVRLEVLPVGAGQVLRGHCRGVASRGPLEEGEQGGWLLLNVFPAHMNKAR